MAVSQANSISNKTTLKVVQKLPSLELDTTPQTLSDYSTTAPSKPLSKCGHPLDSPQLDTKPSRQHSGPKGGRYRCRPKQSKQNKFEACKGYSSALCALPTTVYCAGFAKVLTADQLKHILSEHFGAVQDVLLNVDRSGRSRGSGFAVFASEQSANLAISCTQEYLDGCRIIILPFKGRTKQTNTFAVASKEPLSETVSHRSSRSWGCEKTREQNLSDSNIRFNVGGGSDGQRPSTIAMGQTLCRVN